MKRIIPVMAMMVMGGTACAQSTGDDDTAVDAGAGDSGSLPNGAQIELQHLKVYDAGDNDYIETKANSDARLHGFNRAACTCAKADRGTTPDFVKSATPQSAGWFAYLIDETPASGLHVPVEFFAGNSCTDPLQRDSTCKVLNYDLTSDLDGTFNAGGGEYEPFNLYDIINGELHDGEPCQELEGNAPIYMMLSTTGQTDTFDFQLVQNAGTLSTDPATTANAVDTRPPPPASNVQADPSDQTINLTWTAATSNSADIAYYQVLCADLTGSVIGHRAADARYVTTRSQCGGALGNLTATDLADEQILPITDAVPAGEMPLGSPDPAGAFGQLDEAYICSEATSTASSLSIHGLTNGKPYELIFLTIDLHGNYAARYFPYTVTPLAGAE